jgi:hypothetical protein
VFICRIQPDELGQNKGKINHFITLLTYIAVIDPNNKRTQLVIETNNDDHTQNYLLLQQTAVATLSAIARVSCYSFVQVTHCIKVLINLSSIHEETTTLHRSWSSKSVWELLGKLCRISLAAPLSSFSSIISADSAMVIEDEKLHNQRVHEHRYTTNDQSVEPTNFRKRNRYDDNFHAVEEEIGSVACSRISSVALPHILQSAIKTGKHSRAKNELVALNALLFVLPEEPG